MNAQVNKFRKEQALNDKIMLIVLVGFGLVLLIALAHSVFEYKKANAANPATTSTVMQMKVATLLTNGVEEHDVLKAAGTFYLKPIKARLFLPEPAIFEVEKLQAKTVKTNHAAYKSALDKLCEIEDPELFIGEIMALTKVNYNFKPAPKQAPFTTKENPYLAEIYQKKNEMVRIGIEQWRMANDFENLAENKLGVENWMTSDNFWGISNNDEAMHRNDMAKMLADKKQQVDTEIYQCWLLKTYQKQEVEEVLALENWMMNYQQESEEKIARNDFLAELAQVKIKDTDEMIELLCKTKCCGKPEVELPLAIEDWMTDEKCWCPDLNESENQNSSSFAYLSNR